MLTGELLYFPVAVAVLILSMVFISRVPEPAIASTAGLEHGERVLLFILFIFDIIIFCYIHFCC